METIQITYRSLQEEDWPQVAAIYEEGIKIGNATFETTVPNWRDWDIAHSIGCRLVACIDQKVAGWAALTPVSGRCVYAGVAEVSVYVLSACSGQGIGTKLLRQLVFESEAAGIWTLQAGIFPENVASLLIHKKVGFRKVGYREKIGKINGVWRNTILLERRSSIVGRDLDFSVE